MRMMKRRKNSGNDDENVKWSESGNALRNGCTTACKVVVSYGKFLRFHSSG